MPETLDAYIRQRLQALNISVSALCEEARLSRQAFYDLADIPRKLPTLATLIKIASVLRVHPLRLLNLVFDSEPGLVAAPAASARKLRSDQSAFVRDVTFPDDTLVFPGQRFVKTWEV
jgi:transcriptional regulator with XRE-family HTH domain